MTHQETAGAAKHGDDHGHGPKFEINIEGTIYEWDRETITVPEIRSLGGLPADQPVIEIDLETNQERQLVEDEIVHIKPGMGYAKKVRFKRGWNNE